MKKSHLISLAIFAVTYLLPFRYAVMEVDAYSHGLSTFGVLFTAIGFVAGFYFLLKDDTDKSHGEHENSHH